MTQLGLFGKNAEPLETHVFFDTETTGLPLNWGAPVSDVGNWPRLVQIAWSVYEDGRHAQSCDFIIKPEGFKIPADSTMVHGISHEKAEKEGAPLRDVLTNFQSAMARANVVVAHNISFDEKIVGAEFLRANMQNNLAGKATLCTKEISTTFCAIPKPGSTNFKWPKLSELHQKLFGTEFKDSHNARVDVDTTAKCFFEMKRRGVI